MIRAVIVDDDPMVLSINTKYILKNDRIKVVKSFSNGEYALHYLLREPVELLLLDCYMPNMDGITLLKKIRDAGLQTDVIMITAANDAESIQQALHLGIIDYLIKPFDFKRFKEAIDKYLNEYDLLHKLSTLNQKDIDHVFWITEREKEVMSTSPKGLHPITMKKVVSFLVEKQGEAFTSEEIAEEVGLSRVTIRRYMNYLEQNHQVESQIDYETGGRPSIKYRFGK